MNNITSLSPNGKGLDDLRLYLERARLVGLIKTRGNGHDPAPPTTGHDWAGKSDLDRIIAAEAKCAPAHVRKAREVVRSGREDLIVGMIFDLVSVTAAHRIVRPTPAKTGLRERKRQLLELLGSGQ